MQQIIDTFNPIRVQHIDDAALNAPQAGNEVFGLVSSRRESASRADQERQKFLEQAEALKVGRYAEARETLALASGELEAMEREAARVGGELAMGKTTMVQIVGEDAEIRTIANKRRERAEV